MIETTTFIGTRNLAIVIDRDNNDIYIVGLTQPYPLNNTKYQLKYKGLSDFNVAVVDKQYFTPEIDLKTSITLQSFVIVNVKPVRELIKTVTNTIIVDNPNYGKVIQDKVKLLNALGTIHSPAPTIITPIREYKTMEYQFIITVNTIFGEIGIITEDKEFSGKHINSYSYMIFVEDSTLLKLNVSVRLSDKPAENIRDFLQYSSVEFVKAIDLAMRDIIIDYKHDFIDNYNLINEAREISKLCKSYKDLIV